VSGLQLRRFSRSLDYPVRFGRWLQFQNPWFAAIYGVALLTCFRFSRFHHGVKRSTAEDLRKFGVFYSLAAPALDARPFGGCAGVLRTG